MAPRPYPHQGHRVGSTNYSRANGLCEEELNRFQLLDFLDEGRRERSTRKPSGVTPVIFGEG